MTVRQSLLAILDQSPCYGYQLRGEFDARTGGTWPLNAGQVYSTLERLERDGLITSDGADGEGRVRYSITQAGSAEVAAWLSAPVQRQAARDELAMKLAVAATLPGVSIADVIQVQRSASIATLQELTRTKAGLVLRKQLRTIMLRATMSVFRRIDQMLRPHVPRLPRQ